MRKLAALLPLAWALSACSVNVIRGGAPALTPADPAYDLVITNGRIVDGSGNAWFWGDVGVRRDRIATIAPRHGLAAAATKRQIDAHGQIVAPGFIDIQAQSYEDFMTGNGRVLSMVVQGITTAILAIEGMEPATVVTTDVDSRTMIDSSVMGLVPGDCFTVNDLLYGLMLPSGNDVALALGVGCSELYLALEDLCDVGGDAHLVLHLDTDLVEDLVGQQR